MLIGYIIIALVIAFIVLCLLRWAIVKEERDLNLYSDEPSEETAERKLSAWVIIFAIMIGLIWPLVVVAVLVAGLAVVVAGADI